MTANPLKAAQAPSFQMTAALAQNWARFAAEQGNHDMSALWAKHARELAAQERGEGVNG